LRLFPSFIHPFIHSLPPHLLSLLFSFSLHLFCSLYHYLCLICSLLTFCFSAHFLNFSPLSVSFHAFAQFFFAPPQTATTTPAWRAVSTANRLWTCATCFRSCCIRKPIVSAKLRPVFARKDVLVLPPTSPLPNRPQFRLSYSSTPCESFLVLLLLPSAPPILLLLTVYISSSSSSSSSFLLPPPVLISAPLIHRLYLLTVSSSSSPNSCFKLQWILS
jgi:hypothetical protein